MPPFTLVTTSSSCSTADPSNLYGWDPTKPWLGRPGTPDVERQWMWEAEVGPGDEDPFREEWLQETTTKCNQHENRWKVVSGLARDTTPPPTAQDPSNWGV